jgi:tRNA U55 pseudouridine synthase TruB
MWGFYGLLVSFVLVIGILAHHGWGPENYRLWIVIVSMIVAFIATAVSNDFYFKAIRRDLGEYRAISASFRLLAQEAQKGYKVDAVTIATQNDLLSKITSLNNNRRDLEKVFTPTLNFLKKAQEENIVSQDERTIPSLRLI